MNITSSDNTDTLQAKALAIFNQIVSFLGLKNKQTQFLALSNRNQKQVLAAMAGTILVLVIGTLYLIFGYAVAVGFIASILAGLATGVGGSIALLFKQVPVKVYNAMLGAAGGVMLAATAFSLIVPGMEFGNLLWPGWGIYVVAVGMVMGVLFLDLADRKLPHIHFVGSNEASDLSFRKIWLFIFAITIHNFPEGLSVGVSFGVDNMQNGIALAIAIGLQNIPEGMAVSLPLVALGYNPKKAVIIATLTGLVEPVGALFGLVAVSLFQPILPVAMGFAAGAMLFVISEEIIPETQAKGKARYATFAVIAGFIVMMLLDNMMK
ncbi:hypothetical protein AU255_09875 [Methyloprofundus sedimenti]|uniref:Protein gufA n=1 Tax=Methyloprofundus sedimenti TaxID=1420851 RepID=A0A1V8M988_9GAMM|nr:hypothetical protein AU255_09875 [Methyloprofundus sedimenti]